MTSLGGQLAQWVRGRACLVGIGNVDLGDDALGVRLARSIAARLGGAPGAPRVVDAGNAPERFVGGLARAGFDHVIFLDAVDFGGAPGAVLVADAARMSSRFPQVSTHRLSLGLMARWVEEAGRCRAWLLGVQPASLAPGTALTPAVGEAVEALSDLLSAAWVGGARA